MNEEFPNQESAEKVTKEKVVESLVRNPEDLSLLHKFLDRREAEVRDSKGSLVLNIEVAEIYRDSGLIDFAREAFDSAIQQAWLEKEDDLYRNLLIELDKLR